MSNELTKELMDQFIIIKDTEQKIQKKCHEIICTISNDIKDLFTNGKFDISIKMTDDKQISITITVKDKLLEPYICKNDIFYDSTSLSIELRNIKDTLYAARKTLKEEKPKSFWNKIFW